MASQAPDPNSSAVAKQEDERGRSNRYQAEFDYLILGLVVIGLLLTIFYGASAKTCPPDPAHIAALAQQSPDTAINGRAGASPPDDANRTPSVGDNAARPVPAATEVSRATAATAGPTRAPSSAGRCDPQGSSGFVGALLALAIALAALAVGGAVGFLFGLPRTLTSSDVREATAVRQQAGTEGRAEESGGAPSESGSAAASGSAKSEVNTNLEKISDWLTTIIVGVGLTKLQEIPSALETFGDRVAIYFGYGGKVFGIGGGLFFLIAGFFLAYVGTRVKLSLIFTGSQLDIRGLEVSSKHEVALSKEAPIAPAMDAAAGEGIPQQLQQADDHLLAKSLGDLKTNDEIIAWANAKARAGDYQSALTAYKDVLKRVPLTEKISRDYAIILAATGNQAAAQNVVGALSATANLSAEATREIGQQISVASLQARLREGLYRWTERGFEDSILAGENLIRIDDQSKVGMNHVWLACAYGQKHHWILTNEADTPKRRQALEELESKVVEHVEEALRLQPDLKPLLVSLYDPSRQIGADNDLQSLFEARTLHPQLME